MKSLEYLQLTIFKSHRFRMVIKEKRNLLEVVENKKKLLMIIEIFNLEQLV